MLTFGIYTVEQYARARAKRPLSGASVSYGLLKIGDNPTEQEISRFEDISLIFCTSNGTRRTTCRQRMQDVDAATLELLQRCHQQRADLLMQDRGASSCLTSAEFAGCFFRAFPYANLEASDRLLWVFRISLAKGKTYIIEPDGEPLQYISPPFVVSLNAYKPERSPLRRIIAAQGEEVVSAIGLPEGMSDTQNRPDLLHSPRSRIPQQKGFALPDSHAIGIRTLLRSRRVAHDECSQQGLLPHPEIGRGRARCLPESQTRGIVDRWANF